jgi:hypothetical protein
MILMSWIVVTFGGGLLAGLALGLRDRKARAARAEVVSVASVHEEVTVVGLTPAQGVRMYSGKRA